MPDADTKQRAAFKEFPILQTLRSAREAKSEMRDKAYDVEAERFLVSSLRITAAAHRWPEKQNFRQETKWDLDPC